MVSKWESADYNYSIKSLTKIAAKLNWELDISICKKGAQNKTESNPQIA